MTSKGDKYFLIGMGSVADAYRDAMIKKDIKALQGLTAFDVSEKWATANTGSKVMSYLFKETVNRYDKRKPLPYLNYFVLMENARKRNINPGRLKLVIDALVDSGFIEIKEEIKKSQEGDKKFLYLRLAEMWRFILIKYIRNKKQSITFPHILGRQVYISYLSKNQDTLKVPTGLKSFKNLFIFINNSSTNGEVDNKEAELMFSRTGGIVELQDFGESDEVKKDDIRFFVFLVCFFP